MHSNSAPTEHFNQCSVHPSCNSCMHSNSAPPGLPRQNERERERPNTPKTDQDLPQPERRTTLSDDEKTQAGRRPWFRCRPRGTGGSERPCSRNTRETQTPKGFAFPQRLRGRKGKTQRRRQRTYPAKKKRDTNNNPNTGRILKGKTSDIIPTLRKIEP